MLSAEPLGVVTETGPVLAPAGTVAVICVSESTLNVVAATPLNFTAVAPVNPVPTIFTEAPTAPDDGASDVIPSVVTSRLHPPSIPPKLWMCEASS